MSYLRVKNWDEFQHYKERNPPWIRLYNRLLEDYEFARMDDSAKGQLVLIWLLASRMDNRIPADAEWIASKINATNPVALSTFLSAGFLEPYGDASEVLALCKQDASPEQSRAEAEKKLSVHGFPVKPKKGSDGSLQYPEPFERAWSGYPSRAGSNPKVGAYDAFRKRVAEGADPEQLVIAAAHYRDDCKSRKDEGTKYVLQASTFYGPKEPWREYVESPVANGRSAKRESVPFGKGGARMEL